MLVPSLKTVSVRRFSSSSMLSVGFPSGSIILILRPFRSRSNVWVIWSNTVPEPVPPARRSRTMIARFPRASYVYEVVVPSAASTLLTLSRSS